MGGTESNKHVGVMVQVNFTFQGACYSCMFIREADKEKETVSYKAVVLNEDKVTMDEFLNMFLTAIGAGALPALPVALPSLDVLAVEREEASNAAGKQKISGSTKIYIGLSSGEEKQKLGTLEFMLRNNKMAFLIRIIPAIRFSGIPLAEHVFKEQDGISDITVAWLQGKGTEESQFGISFILTIGDWKQAFHFGCLEKSAENAKAAEEADSRKNQNSAEQTVFGLMNKKEQRPAAAKPDKDQKVDKKKGPFSIRQIGMEFQTPEGGELRVFLKFSVLLSFSVLDMQMMGLKLGLPLKELTSFKPEALKNLEFDMEGLAVDFQNHGLMISGALRKVNASYSGAIRVKYKNFELSAAGAYEKLPDGSHSLFIWLLVRYPLGGPPAFFITGLAGGFGLNRRLKIPEIGQVKDFPLVAMARGNTGSPNKPAPGAGEVLNLLSPYIEPENGSYFIALGLEFTTFELLRTFALGIVTFGTDLEIHLLGLTTLSMPPNSDKPFVYAELLLKASILPEKGVLSLEGQLSGESYLFDRNCKLTGGFAMYLWFGNHAHAGDFVVTIGGYHPQFSVPSHYPSVGRVGIRWMILPQLTLEGGVYFALTPTGIMAGGNLSILYQWGELRAWFIANADFLMQWAPLRYDIFVQVSLGVSYTFRIFGFRKTLRVELGASLHLYGPEFAGEVSVSWFVISFTIRFGQRNAIPPRLSWIEFKTKFLNDAQKFRVLAGMNAQDTERKIPLLDGKRMVLLMQSKIPMTEVWLGGEKQAMPAGSRTDPGVLPMGENNRLSNQVHITLNSRKNGVYTPHPAKLNGILRMENVPPALWGRKRPSMNETKLLSGAVTLVEIRLFRTEPQPHYYKESTLMENQVVEKPVNMIIPCYRERMEYMGKNLENKLEDWEREKKIPKSEQLKHFEEQKEQVLDALYTMFPLWEKEKLSRDLTQKRGTIFLVEPAVRTFS